MPLEIRELTIKVNVTEQSSTLAEADVYKAVRSMKEELIKDCVEKVFKKIQKSSDR